MFAWGVIVTLCTPLHISGRAWRLAVQGASAPPVNHRRFFCACRFMVGYAGAPSGAPVPLYAGPPIPRNPPPCSAWRQSLVASSTRSLHEDLISGFCT
ncbi:hypothetical protein HBH25_22630 [Pseudomonas sp. hsmgli-8]|uniref:Secreted protein n=1 Tax=Pseudomonas quercus TaxID=2722792 RepID=A0ABX0YJN5_9PSED|nr:ash family protein [Pseudomonas sp. LY10J]NJP03620.1 hypothetical protein [Pseudomonas quercus]